MITEMKPRGIAVVDVGFTNTKVILYDAGLRHVAELKTASPHCDGQHYREIDVAAIVSFAKQALVTLDQTVPSFHAPMAHALFR
jgi:sugar (pentulose or hexulose) kinase